MKLEDINKKEWRDDLYVLNRPIESESVVAVNVLLIVLNRVPLLPADLKDPSTLIGSTS